MDASKLSAAFTLLICLVFQASALTCHECSAMKSTKDGTKWDFVPGLNDDFCFAGEKFGLKTWTPKKCEFSSGTAVCTKVNMTGDFTFVPGDTRKVIFVGRACEQKEENYNPGCTAGEDDLRKHLNKNDPAMQGWNVDEIKGKGCGCLDDDCNSSSQAAVSVVLLLSTIMAACNLF